MKNRDKKYAKELVKSFAYCCSADDDGCTLDPEWEWGRAARPISGHRLNRIRHELNKSNPNFRVHDGWFSEMEFDSIMEIVLRKYGFECSAALPDYHTVEDRKFFNDHKKYVIVAQERPRGWWYYFATV